jgi:hypothetical protein
MTTFRVGVEAMVQRTLQEGMQRDSTVMYETKALPKVDGEVEATLRVNKTDSDLAMDYEP